MNKAILFIFLISLFSSNSEQSISVENKVFIIGSNSHFDNYKPCDFFFECDCCFGEIVFLTDSKFIYVDYCTSDYSLFGGTYSVNTENVILKFTNQKVEIDYNWDYELDKTVQQYFVNDTIFHQPDLNFNYDKCGENQMLVFSDKNFTWIAKESVKKPNEVFDKFKAIGQLGQLEKFMK